MTDYQENTGVDADFDERETIQDETETVGTEFIDEMMHRLEDNKFLQQRIANSIIWSFAYRYSMTYVDTQREGVDNPWSEEILLSTPSIISYFARFSPPGQYAPDPTQMVDTFMSSESPEFETDMKKLKDYCNKFGKSVEQAKRRMQTSHNELIRRQKIQKAALEKNKETLITTLNTMLESDAHLNTVSLYNAIVIGDKALAKAETQLDNIEDRYLRARSTRRQNAILAEKPHVEAFIDWVSDELDKLEETQEQEQMSSDPNGIH